MRSAYWQWLEKRSDVHVAIAGFSVALIGIVWGSMMVELRSERREAIATAAKQNSNLAIAYEQHVIRTLKGLDAVTAFLRHEYDQHGRKLDIPHFISEGLVDPNLFSILSVVDERGDVVLSSNPSATAANYADRAHFQVHRLQDVDGLYISEPVFGRVSSTWQIPMSRRINNPDGTFGGIVVLSIDPGYFTRFYQKADLGAQGLVALVGLDGISRARRIGDALSFGDDMSGSSLLQQRAIEPTGSYFDAARPDAVGRYISYRTLADYPLVVAVGTAEDEVLAQFARNRTLDYWVAILVSVVIAIFAALLGVTTTRQKRVAAALADDIAERKRLEAELRELATTDMLTSLPNRRHFLLRLQEEHARLRRFDALHAAVLMLDLDHFKRVNDTYGHAAGDAVLRHFADVVRTQIRQIDTASRLGGEEFAIVLPGATHVSALEFAERLRRKAAESPAVHDARRIQVTVSIGIAVMDAHDASAEAALARADEALYRAKEGGRNRVEIVLEREHAGC